MKIEVNGEPKDVSAATLADLLQQLDYAGSLVATARNGQFVRKSERMTTQIQAGDRIEILMPRQGG